MIVLTGKEEYTMSFEEFHSLTTGFGKICLDIGTGDGKNVYRKARANPDTLYIGIDPAKDNMLEIASKASKKPEKGGAPNMLLVLACAEALPPELDGCADEVTVLFPWGILLEGIIKPKAEFLSSIRKAAKNGAAFEFVTTYCGACEENTINIRGLPELSMEYFQGEYNDTLRESGYIIETVELHGNDYVKNFDSKWAKRLAFGRKRDFFRVTGTIN